MKKVLETTFPLTSAIVSDAVRMQFGRGSDVVRMCFGCGSGVGRMWFGGVFGAGADSLEWFPAEEGRRTNIVCFVFNRKSTSYIRVHSSQKR